MYYRVHEDEEEEVESDKQKILLSAIQGIIKNALIVNLYSYLNI